MILPETALFSPTPTFAKEPTFLSDVRKNIGKEISKNYSKVGEKWQVTEVSREIPADKIPDEIYDRMEMEDSDSLELTEDIEAQLLSNYQ